MDRDDHSPAIMTAGLIADLSTIPARWRVQVDRWRIVLDQLHEGTLSKADACAALRCSLATLNRKIAAVGKFGVRGLVPDYHGATALPAAFVEHWKALQERYQRKTAPAMRELYRQWSERYPIPGYTAHPGWPELPRGWDKRNLYRYQPSKLELTALRHGLGRAAMKHGPKIRNTRVGLHHLQIVTADDVKLDMKSHIATRRQTVTQQQIGFLDVRSANRFFWGTMPSLKRDDGTRSNVNESHMRFAFCGQLLQHGMSRRGTTYLLEHGTATLRDRVIDILNRYYGPQKSALIQSGVFKVEFSGMVGKTQAICGMGDGKGGGGNPFFKTWIESLHNLMHNELAALPAATGHDRDEPEFLGVIERENEQIFKLAQSLQPEFAALLKFPTLEYYSQLVPAVNHILERINARTDHNLEGWTESGFLTRAYRLTADSQEWKTDGDLMALPAPVRDAYLHMSSIDKRCFLPRKLSPAEVFGSGAAAGEVIRPPQSVIAEILYEDLARPATVRDFVFTVQDIEIAPEPMHFESRVTLPDGREEELRDRETYDVVLSPFDTSRLYVFSGSRSRGAFLGTAKRDERIQNRDREAAERAWGRNNKRFAEALQGTRNRNAGRTREAAERRGHNADVVGSQAEFARRATALLNETLTHDNTHTHPTHESPEIDW